MVLSLRLLSCEALVQLSSDIVVLACLRVLASLSMDLSLWSSLQMIVLLVPKETPTDGILVAFVASFCDNSSTISFPWMLRYPGT